MAVEFVKASSQYVDFGSPAVLAFSTEFTIMCWAYRPSGGEESGLMYHGGGWSDAGYGFHWISGTNLRFEMQNSGGTPKIATDFAVPFAEWHHVAATWSTADNLMRKYLDGVIDATTGTFNATLSSPSVNLRFASVTSQGRPMGGYMADARLYNRILTPVELQAIVTQRGADTIKNGLAARWLLNENAPGVALSGAGVVIDVSGNGSHGTPTNSPTGVEAQLGVRRRRAA